MTTILSIQSSVAYGHVGNSAAAFPLMRMGIEVWPVITVHFSNHTGYGQWRGPLLSAEDVREVVKGIDERGVLGKVDALLTGYQGDPAVGAAVIDILDLMKSRNDKAIYCCDPVIGDEGRGVYVKPGIPEFFRGQVIPRADIVTPNHFELNLLTDSQAATLPELLDAAQRLRATGPEVVLVTSAVLPDAGDDVINMLAVSSAGAWLVTTPRLDRNFTGSGDITAALFLAHYLRSGSDVAESLGATASAVYSLLKATADAGQSELALVAAQEELVHPSHVFTAKPVR